jgi:NADPH-dependent 7-cyano-7-deazaguanine reductase QueF-like protein
LTSYNLLEARNEKLVLVSFNQCTLDEFAW